MVNWKIEKELDQFENDKLVRLVESDREIFHETVFSYVSGEKYWQDKKWKVVVERITNDELMQVAETTKRRMKKTVWKYESGLKYWVKKVYGYPKPKKEKGVASEGKKKV